MSVKPVDRPKTMMVHILTRDSGKYYITIIAAQQCIDVRCTKAEGIRILSTNTAGHAEIQACGEAVRLVGTCAKKRGSEKQESPVTPLCG
jgi:hypothetical protein